MSVWSSITQTLKGMVRRMIGSKTIEQELHLAPTISSRMEHAIRLWGDMYMGQAPWLKEPTADDPTRVVSLGLPSLIASEKARMALLEFESEITAPNKELSDKDVNYKNPEPSESADAKITSQTKLNTTGTRASTSDRAQYLNTQYTKLKKQLRKQLEYGIAKGGLVIKPYLVANTLSGKENDWQMEFDFIQADSFFPLSFDANGRITEAAFIQMQTEKDIIYRRLEYHKWENNTVKIVNKAYKSNNNQANRADLTSLGKEIPLTDVACWRDLQEEVVIENVQKPLFAYFKMPEANTIEPTSPLGVSGYSRAVSLIKDADMQYSRLLWEYEGGELAIDVDRNALDFMELKDRNGNPTGHSTMPMMQKRLYRKVDLNDGDTYQQFAPLLRDSSYIHGLNTIFMRIEDVTGLSRGTVSDASSVVERTATELKILKQRSYQTNADIQQALEDTLRDAVYIMDAYCDLYEIVDSGDYDISFEWDDSIIVDVDTELDKRLVLQQNNLASRVENRMWYFGETERQAIEALEKIDAEAAKDASRELNSVSPHLNDDEDRYNSDVKRGSQINNIEKEKET